MVIFENRFWWRSTIQAREKIQNTKIRQTENNQQTKETKTPKQGEGQKNIANAIKQNNTNIDKRVGESLSAFLLDLALFGGRANAAAVQRCIKNTERQEKNKNTHTQSTIKRGTREQRRGMGWSARGITIEGKWGIWFWWGPTIEVRDMTTNMLSQNEQNKKADKNPQTKGVTDIQDKTT